MSLDTSKPVKSITYNGTPIHLDNAELEAVRAELSAKEAELAAKEAEMAAQQAIEDSLVEVTALTTYYNNRVSKVGIYAFYSSNALENVHLPKATLIQYSAFSGCTVLQEVIFEKATMISDYTFYNCRGLTRLVLGESAVCGLNGANIFTNTPIAGGTGYVYVRDELVDSYKTATNRATYANQIKPISELQTNHPEIYAKLEL